MTQNLLLREGEAAIRPVHAQIGSKHANSAHVQTLFASHGTIQSRMD
jgi:hypothetical protein